MDSSISPVGGALVSARATSSAEHFVSRKRRIAAEGGSSHAPQLEERVAHLEGVLSQVAQGQAVQSREFQRELLQIRQTVDQGVGNLSSIIQTSLHTNKLVLDHLNNKSKETGEGLAILAQKQGELGEALNKQQMLSLMLLQKLGVIKMSGLPGDMLEAAEGKDGD